jgi:hypothetical protein
LSERKALEIFKIGDIVKPIYLNKDGGPATIVDVQPVFDDFYGMVMHYNYTLIAEKCGKYILKDRDLLADYVVVGKCESAKILFGDKEVATNAFAIFKIHDEYIIDFEVAPNGKPIAPFKVKV